MVHGTRNTCKKEWVADTPVIGQSGKVYFRAIHSAWCWDLFSTFLLRAKSKPEKNYFSSR
jgi:hypothetical protein